MALVNSSDPSNRDHSVHVAIGCGSIRVEPYPAPDLSIGLDIDVEALRPSTRGWRLVGGDGGALPFRGDSLSSVLLQAVLHHIYQTDRAIREVARVLHDGGQLIIVDGVALADHEAQRLDAELVDAGLPREPRYGLDPTALARTVAKHGLTVDSVVLDGTATFATPPHVSRYYTSDRFRLTARK